MEVNFSRFPNSKSWWRYKKKVYKKLNGFQKMNSQKKEEFLKAVRIEELDFYRREESKHMDEMLEGVKTMQDMFKAIYDTKVR